jgi:hypothetical protein
MTSTRWTSSFPGRYHPSATPTRPQSLGLPVARGRGPRRRAALPGCGLPGHLSRGNVRAGRPRGCI